MTYKKPKVVVGDGEVQTAREHTGNFGGGQENILDLNFSSGYASIDIYQNSSSFTLKIGSTL